MGLVRMGPPVELIQTLQSAFGVASFVETGTYVGATASQMSRYFRRVYTIEASRELYDRASRNLGDIRNVECIFGDSRSCLERVASRLDGPAVFWLDAHWCGAQTCGEGDECPLIDEIRIINRCRPDGFVFIDDARHFTSPPQPPHRIEQWPDITAVLGALRPSGLDRYVVIIEDVIIAVPAPAKPTLARYCQEVKARDWAELSRQKRMSDLAKGIRLLYDGARLVLRAPARGWRRIVQPK